MTTNKKILKAVAPFIHPEFLNFKTAPYEAWRDLGGMTAKSHYPIRTLHGPVFRRELPTLWKSRKEARLRFVEPISLLFDTFPDYARYEIVPMVWDCWPKYFELMAAWLKRHDVRTVIFTCRETALLMQKRFPKMNIMHCQEGINSSEYIVGKSLKDRKIDVLEFGRKNDRIFPNNILDRISLEGEKINHVCTYQDGHFIYTNEQLHEAMGDAKIAIALPRCLTQPEVAEGLETLTQRYWECMLSRTVLVGHAPQELVDYIGYNPVVELQQNMRPEAQVAEVLAHIENYQEIVDRNRCVALEKGDWKVRMKDVMAWLESAGYITKYRISLKSNI